MFSSIVPTRILSLTKGSLGVEGLFQSSVPLMPKPPSFLGQQMYSEATLWSGHLNQYLTAKSLLEGVLMYGNCDGAFYSAPHGKLNAYF